jgi:hypothetical protein
MVAARWGAEAGGAGWALGPTADAGALRTAGLEGGAAASFPWLGRRGEEPSGPRGSAARSFTEGDDPSAGSGGGPICVDSGGSSVCLAPEAAAALGARASGPSSSSAGGLSVSPVGDGIGPKSSGTLWGVEGMLTTDRIAETAC